MFLEFSTILFYKYILILLMLNNCQPNMIDRLYFNFST